MGGLSKVGGRKSADYAHGQFGVAGTQDFFILESNQDDALLFQSVLAHRIVCPNTFLVVDTSIDFDSESSRGTVKIKDVLPDRALPQETKSAASSRAENLPKPPLRWRLILAKLSCVVSYLQVASCRSHVALHSLQRLKTPILTKSPNIFLTFFAPSLRTDEVG